MDWIKYIDFENIEERYGDIVEVIGIENFMKIVNRFGGSTIYIPKMKTIYSGAIKEYILKEYNGNNKRKLANKFDLSEKTVQNIINENRHKNFWKNS